MTAPLSTAPAAPPHAAPPVSGQAASGTPAPASPSRARPVLMALALLAPLLLGSCSLLAPAPATAPPAAGVPDARQLDAWRMEGKAGVRFLGQTVSATYSWQRLGDGYDAEAAGPLNQGRTTLSSRDGWLVLENAWLGRRESASAELLAKALTGIPIPLDSLNAWLTGWPAETDTAITPLAEPDGLREFSERGWTTRVMGEQVLSGYRVPTRLVMTQANNRIVLTVAGWQPGSPPTVDSAVDQAGAAPAEAASTPSAASPAP